MRKFNLEDVFHIHHKVNYGIVLTGRMIEGNINIGDIILLPDGNRLEVLKLEMFRKAFNTVKQGDNVGIYVGDGFTREYLNSLRKSILDITSLEELRNSKIEQLGL